MLILVVRVINRKHLDSAKKKYSDSRKAIDSWLTAIEKIKPKNFFELKQTFSRVDLVGEDEVLVCFDIKGTHYRLITKMNYPNLAIIKEFLKHSDYDKKYRYRGRNNEYCNEINSREPTNH